MTINYLKRRKDQFIRDWEQIAKEKITDDEYRQLFSMTVRATLDAFIVIIERENK